MTTISSARIFAHFRSLVALGLDAMPARDLHIIRSPAEDGVGLQHLGFAWLVWYFGPELELMRPVLSGVDDPALRAVLQEAHAERLGIWVAIWPVTLLVLSFVIEKKVQG